MGQRPHRRPHLEMGGPKRLTGSSFHFEKKKIGLLFSLLRLPGGEQKHNSGSVWDINTLRLVTAASSAPAQRLVRMLLNQ